MSRYNFYGAEWLVLLLLIPLIVLVDWYYLRHKFPVLVVPAIARVQYSWREKWFSPAKVLLAIRVLTLFFAVLALADLRSIKLVRNDLPAADADIVLALDISRSMMTEDIKPNRLEALKTVLTHFVAAGGENRFGIVMYAGESLVLCPLTRNHAFLLNCLNKMDDKAMADGTAIGVGIASAVNALRDSPLTNKIIILITDGENNTGDIDPITASELAKKFKIKIYTIGIGSTGMAPFPVKDFNGKKTYVYIKTAIDEAMLTRIAENTGGSYFRATDANGLQQIYKGINQLQKIKKVNIDLLYDWDYRYFLFIAMFLLLLEIILRFTIYRAWLA